LFFDAPLEWDLQIYELSSLARSESLSQGGKSASIISCQSLCHLENVMNLVS